MHILQLPPTTTASERAQLARLSKNQLRYLSRRACALCDWPLDRAACGSAYEACPESIRIERRARCLEQYKPRGPSHGQ